MALITIVRRANLLAAGAGDGSLPPELQLRLERDLRYTHIACPGPGEVFTDDQGNPVKVLARDTPLYSLDKYGRLICFPGYLSRISDAAAELGHTVEVRDIPPPAHQPLKANRFEPDWDYMFDVLGRHGYDLRPGQEAGMVAVASHERGLFEAPPGYGKGSLFTFLALAYRHARVHVVVDGAAIIDRLYREMVRFFPDVGRVGGGKKKFSRVTLVSAQSLNHVAFDDPTHPSFPDLVFADEAHLLVAPTLWEYVTRYRWCRIFGFSATLEGRFDQADKALESFFGPVIYRMTYPEAVALKLVVPIEVEWLPVEMPDPTAGLKRDCDVSQAGIWRNDARNKILMDRILQIDPDESTLILTETIDQLMFLKKHYPPLTVVYDDLEEDRYNWYARNGLLDPRHDPIMTPQLRHKLTRQFEANQLFSGNRRLVAANRIWNTGVSFDHLETLAVAHGMGSRIKAVQGPGRVSRTSVATGKTVGRVIDLYDRWSKRSERAAKDRSSVYAKQEWKQTGIPKVTRGTAHRRVT